jgi:hypothetical protein
MSTYDNQPPVDGWALPYREHCGEWHQSIACPTCAQTIPPELPPNIFPGDN